MIIIWIIVAILMFSVIVIIHELGHFLASRFFGVKVEEFWLWIPPFAKKIFTDKKGTKYTLNWLPLWGFVRLKWEDPSPQPSPLEERELDNFSEKSYFAKTIILLWGVFMNFLLAWIIFSILFFVWVKPIWINSQIETDLDVKIIPNLEQALKSGLLKKDWKKYIVNREFEYKYWVIDSMKYWFLETYNQSLLTIKWIGILWQKIFNPKTKTEREEAVSNMKWPIWIVDLVANSLSAGVVFLLILSAIISINLWVFNLLPIPALDWWRWLLISISTFLKKIFWEKVSTQNFENYMHLLFFIILIALSLFIGYNDVVNIIKK